MAAFYELRESHAVYYAGRAGKIAVLIKEVRARLDRILAAKVFAGYKFVLTTRKLQAYNGCAA